MSGTFRRLGCALFLGLSSVLPLAASGPAFAVNSVLQAYPYEGHSGDTIFLSGSGFDPYKRLYFLVACPKWDSPDAAKFHNFQLYPGPTTGANGNFVGYPLRHFQLTGVDQSPCRIYASYIDKSFVSDFPAPYQIVPSDTALPKKARFILAKVSPRPKRVKAGFVENIAIDGGWGGATAQVTVTYPGLKPLNKKARLDWKGSARIAVKIDTRLAQPGLVTVKVHFRLGRATGQSVASFTVVR